MISCYVNVLCYKIYKLYIYINNDFNITLQLVTSTIFQYRQLRLPCYLDHFKHK